MKLLLFGGAEISLGQFEPQLNLIEEEILKINPKQILHIPFARIKVSLGEEEYWGEGWYWKMKKLKSIEYLNASNEEDINKAKKPLIFVSGGHDRDNLLKKLVNNSKLLNLVKSTKYYFGESSGAMIVGSYLRHGGKGSELFPGLNILRSTIIEPHYKERNSQHLLRDEIKEKHLKYGIGIDCVTAVIIDTNKFPDQIKKIGQGNFEIIK